MSSWTSRVSRQIRGDTGTKNPKNLKGGLRLCIVGNPVTSISSGKFLMKFIKILAPFSSKIFVINDGFPKISDQKILNLKLPTLVTRFYCPESSFLKRCVGFIIVETSSILSIIKCSSQIDLVIILPTAGMLQILVSKLVRKRSLIMAAQDVTMTVSKQNIFGSLSRNFFQISARVALNFSDLIIVESENVIDSLKLGYLRNKIVVSPVYVDLSFYELKKKLQNRENIVGYIGGLTKLKGVEEFANAIPLIIRKSPNVLFVFGGAGLCLSSLKRKLDEYIFQNVVFFKENIPEKSLPECLNELKLLILPSYTEGLPNIILEAMACGTPVLATSVGGIPDVVKDGKTGFIIADNSAESICRGVIRALSCQQLSEIAINARSLVESNYSYAVAVQRYNDVLIKLYYKAHLAN